MANHQIVLPHTKFVLDDTTEFHRAVQELLQSSRQWDIEYRGFLSNHITHNWVVLASTGADEEKLAWWTDTYLSKHPLEPARNGHHNNTAIITAHNFGNFLSNDRTNYPALLRFFDEQIASAGTLSTVVQQYMPALSAGVLGSALHPLIHLGLALEIDSKAMAAEGLAYLACSYQPILPQVPPEQIWKGVRSLERRGGGLITTDGTGNSSGSGLLDATLRFLELAKAKMLIQCAQDISAMPHNDALPIGSFQKRTRAFCMSTADEESCAVGTVSLGIHINAVGPVLLPHESESLLNTIELATVLVTALFISSNCEFFIIHAVTSLHSLLVILPVLSSPREQREALVHWWRAIMAVLVAESMVGVDGAISLIADYTLSVSCAAGTSSSASSSLSSSSSAQRRSSSDTTAATAAISANCTLGDDFTEEWWDQTLHTAQTSKEEHISKSVYVLWRWFTATTATTTAPTINAQKRSAADETNTDPTVAAASNTYLFCASARKLFAQGAAHQVRPSSTGKIEDNIYFVG